MQYIMNQMYRLENILHFMQVHKNLPFPKYNFIVENVSGPYESRLSPWSETSIIHIVRYQLHLVLHRRMTNQLLQLIFPVVPSFPGADEIIALR